MGGVLVWDTLAALELPYTVLTLTFACDEPITDISRTLHQNNSGGPSK